MPLFRYSTLALRQKSSLHEFLGRLQSTGLTSRGVLPTPLETLDGLGGTVEGLLLTADADGRPTDDFAWCLAIYHPSGFPLGRLGVPAARAASAWRRQVDNIIAGIALSSWYQPLDTAGHQPVARPARRGDDLMPSQPGVRILDIDPTSPNDAPRQGQRTTARSPRPHLRRGYWRRYRIHVSDGGQATWYWVRATTVNGMPLRTEQVYVLRGRGNRSRA